MMTNIKKHKPQFFGFPALTEDFFNDGFFPEFKQFDNFPATNIEETENLYNISIAIPGLEKNDVTVEMDGNLLVISAEKEFSDEEKNKNFTRKEYNYNSFKRTFTLPENIQKEDIKANFKNGELLLAVPKMKTEIKKSRLIEIS